MPGVVPGIHVLWDRTRPHKKVVDGRDEPGHDAVERRTLVSYAIAPWTDGGVLPRHPLPVVSA